jgi:hypothetical protein
MMRGIRWRVGPSSSRAELVCRVGDLPCDGPSGRVVILLQEFDYLLPNRRVAQTAVRFHVIVGNNRLGIFYPALQRCLVPRHPGLPQAL